MVIFGQTLQLCVCDHAIEAKKLRCTCAPSNRKYTYVLLNT